jgi:conjugal transfer pilus assembly protein TraK
MVEDNARVECVASQRDLTRISLVGDAFASVSKVQPETRSTISRWSTSRRAATSISRSRAGRRRSRSSERRRRASSTSSPAGSSRRGAADLPRQSRRGSRCKSADADEGDQQAPDLDETAVRLVQAMAGQKVVPGFRMEKAALVPVRAGDVTVQLLAQYRGLDLTGRVLRIENTGKAATDLSEAQIAPATRSRCRSPAPPRAAPGDDGLCRHAGPRDRDGKLEAAPQRRPSQHEVRQWH